MTSLNSGNFQPYPLIVTVFISFIIIYNYRYKIFDTISPWRHLCTTHKTYNNLKVPDLREVVNLERGISYNNYKKNCDCPLMFSFFRGRITEDFVTRAISDVGKQVLTGENDASCDLTFVCSNGKIRAHQVKLQNFDQESNKPNFYFYRCPILASKPKYIHERKIVLLICKWYLIFV